MPPGTADRTLVRIVEGVSGHVAMETELVIRFDYGVTIPWVRRVDTKTTTAVAGPASSYLAHAGADCMARICIRWPRFTVKKGERVPFVMSYSQSQLEMPPVIDADIALEETEKYWADWAGHLPASRANGATRSCARCSP